MRTVYLAFLVAFLFLVLAAVVHAACTTQSFYDVRTGRLVVCTTCTDSNGRPISTICS